jgi:hypothetical protein
MLQLSTLTPLDTTILLPRQPRTSADMLQAVNRLILKKIQKTHIAQLGNCFEKLQL